MLTRSGTSTPPFTSSNLHAPAQSLSCVQLLVTPWTVVLQAPLSLGFSRQEYWNGLPFPPLGDLPDPGMEPESPVPPALAGRFFTTGPPGKSSPNLQEKIVNLS